MTRSDLPGHLGFVAIGNVIYACQGLQIVADQPSATALVMAKSDGPMSLTMELQSN